jgi:hypothetical protein
MRTSSKLFFLFLTVHFFLADGVLGSDLSFRVYGGLGYADGGDLSRSISGWRSYYQGRQGDGFSSSYELGDGHGIAEVGAEVVLALSRRWRLSLGLGYIHQKTSGEITTQTIRHEDIAISPSELWTLDFEQATEQRPIYTKWTIPVILNLDYSLELSAKWTLTLGGGGGIYPGRLEYEETYGIQSESVSEQKTGNGIVQLIDNLTTTGDYSEETKSTGFGLHGRLGLEFDLGSSTFLSFMVLGRWVNMKGWEGTRRDASEWQRTYGLWGSQSAEGTDERAEDGQYWTYDLKDEKTGKSYPVLIFRDAAPSPSSRPASINLSGVSVQVGLGFRFGGKD